MQLRTLNYQEITKAAEEQIRRIAALTIKYDHQTEKLSRHWVTGVVLCWQRLTDDLRRKGDTAADNEFDTDADLHRLENLFTPILEQLREEAAQAAETAGNPAPMTTTHNMSIDDTLEAGRRIGVVNDHAGKED